MEYFTLHGRGDVRGEPVEHGDEMTLFVVDCYAVGDSAQNNHLLYDSAFFSRPKGCDKSGLGARFALFEALGPCRFAGWAEGGETYTDPWGLGFVYTYEPGEPMGAPVTDPYIRIMATEEGQTGNVYDSIHYNLTDGPLSGVPGLDVGLTRVMLPFGGEITPSTASSSSKDGGLETFVCFDETHLYTTPELHRMYATVKRNSVKRKKTAGTWYLETTTMFAPGEESVAESTYGEAEAIRKAGEAGRQRPVRLLYDHRWGECKDLADEPALRAALVEAFGDAIVWQDLDSLVATFMDVRNSVEDSRRFFLNARTAAGNAWITPAAWAACEDAGKALRPGERVTLGFDGSINEDSTALVACRLSDGHLVLLGCWEKPDGPDGAHWRVPSPAVDAAVAKAFKDYDVVGFYADPALWQDYVDAWTAEFGERLQVAATQRHPVEWWTNRPTAMVAALERFETAVKTEALTHDGGATLTSHVLHARRQVSRAGVQIRKETKDSPLKIDAAMAATLAYECRSDAVAKGLLAAPEEMLGWTF
ncbi:terminase [Embleya sp. NPDC056575]|uniref:terminase n=1 Tax=unclassified Embleya TaxID=2699296 RepID=UPI0036AA6233